VSDITEITLTVNGEARTCHVEPHVTLADHLRSGLSLTGTHLGCEHGVCGSCTVLVDGDPVRSCLMLAVQARGCHIETVEGLGSPGAMHPLQEAFAESGALQCGFCTPGFLMTGIALLRKNPAPTPREVREAISGNLCRCTGYSGIIDAISRTGSP
jgi:carbon-monoxide dehydrogenase small subunit